MRAWAGSIVAAVLLVGCGKEAPRERLDLTRGFEPGDLLEGPRLLGDGLAWLPSDRAADPYGLWITGALPSERWTALGPGLWSAPKPVGNVDLLQSGFVPDRLRSKEIEFEPVGADFRIERLAEVPTGRFATVFDTIYLKLDVGQTPPEGLRFETFVTRGAEYEGAWRVELGRWTAFGVPIWTGGTELLSLPPGPACDLLLGTASIAPRVGDPDEGDRGDGDADQGASARFVVEVGREAPSWSHVQPTTGTGLLTRHRIPLPASDQRRTLRLRLEGAPTVGAFLNPTLAPRQDPPPPNERPDLLLFLADTFRADNLTAYGGTHALTPELDALIEDSLLFERAWTPAIWTLPSQASMMTGLLPFQHTALRPGRRIPRAAVTLAEHLRAAGYRTGAITDAGLVSRRHAFDQGFEFFDELFRDDFVNTHQAALDFLDADDGRPTFLFVQTYRVHRPYRVSAETRAEHGARLGIEGQFDATFAELEAAGWKSGRSPLPPQLEDTVRRLEAQYRGGVIDFDRDFGAFMEALGSRRFFDHGRLLFTSDHGEAFAEHGALWHHIGVWETMARVPFFVHGHGIDAGRSPLSASLVDVPRTLSALAGLDPDPSWDGASTLDLSADRIAWTFQCPPELPGLMGIVEGPTKAHLEASTAALAPPRLEGLFDLARDPGEQQATLLAPSVGVDFIAEREALARDALTPRFETDDVPLGSDAEAMLKALGYLDGE